MKTTKFLCFTALFYSFFAASAQLPNPALIGYWHNWDTGSAPYIRLDQIDSRYNIIDIAFALPKRSVGSTYDMEFIPEVVNATTLKSQIQTLQSQGKKVIISIGGAYDAVKMNTTAERDIFVSSMTSIINQYEFDGLDIDLEGNSILLTGGTITEPVDQPIINLIEGIKQIMANYYQKYDRKLILTMAPEAAYVQGGIAAYGSIWGAYLPVIDALRDEIDILHVQLYNSGPMPGIDGGSYSQGTADFIVSQTEAVIKGFNTTGGYFAGLPASKVAVGLPACSEAAGGGYTDPAAVAAAINYLLGSGPKPGSYTLANPAGYPDLRGMMTWSINLDKVASCNKAYEYAENFENIFGAKTSVETVSGNAATSSCIYPNPASNVLTIQIADKNLIPGDIQIFNSLGGIVRTKSLDSETQNIDISDLSDGIYFLKTGNHGQKFIKQR